MFEALSVPFGAKMLFNTVKLKPGVTMEDAELAIGEMCNVVKNAYGGDKGGFVGGAIRYQSGAFSQTDTRDPSVGGTGKDYFTKGTLFTDAFVGYPFRMPCRNLPASVQLNGRNIFNSDLVSLARYNADFSGARRIYLREPRSWRLTLSLEY